MRIFIHAPERSPVVDAVRSFGDQPMNLLLHRVHHSDSDASAAPHSGRFQQLRQDFGSMRSPSRQRFAAEIFAADHHRVEM
jgi:hypothetical protein